MLKPKPDIDERIDQLEKKLDAIMRHFGIGQEQQRPTSVIRQMAKQKVLQLHQKQSNRES